MDEANEKDSITSTPENANSLNNNTDLYDGQIDWIYITGIIVISIVLLQFAAQYVYVFVGCFLSLIITCILIIKISKPTVKSNVGKPLKANFPRISLTSKKNWENAVNSMNVKNSTESLELIFPEQFLISDSLQNIVDLIIKDFVESWFSRISKDHIFIIELKRQFCKIFRSLKDRLENTDIPELIVLKIVPLLNEHFNNYVLARETVKNKKSIVNRVLTSNLDFETLIVSNYNKGKLHPAIKLRRLDDDDNLKSWISSMVGKLLPYLVDSGEISSPPVFILLREIVGFCITFPVLNMVTDPDFWNQLIITRLGDVMKDRNHVKQFRNILNKHSNISDNQMDANNNKNNTPNDGDSISNGLNNNPNDISSSNSTSLITNDKNLKKRKKRANPLLKRKLTLKSDDTEFDKIMKSINKNGNIYDLKDFKYYLSLNINKSFREKEKFQKSLESSRPPFLMSTKSLSSSSILMSTTSSSNSTWRKIELLKLYNQRLLLLKDATDRRLVDLVAYRSSSSNINFDSGSGIEPILGNRGITGGIKGNNSQRPAIKLDLTLSYILSNPATLSFFMEFMEQRGRSALLQFWLIVNGIRNPLETFNDDDQVLTDSDSDYDSDNDDISSKGKLSSNELNSNSMSQSEDIKQIYEQYFSNRLLKIDPKSYKIVTEFVTTYPEKPNLYLRSRRCLIQLQKKTFDRMESSDFIAFKQSDLFLRLLAAERTITESRLNNAQINKLGAGGIGTEPVSGSASGMEGIGTESNATQEEEEWNGDPLANYTEDDEYDYNDNQFDVQQANDSFNNSNYSGNGNKKVSDAVIKAFEDALNQIMKNDDPVNVTDKSTLSNDSTFNISGGKSVSLTQSGNSNRNSRLIDTDTEKDLFGSNDESSTLFDDNADTATDSEKGSTRLFDDSSDEDDDSFHASESLASSVNNLTQSQELTLAAPNDLNLSEQIDNLNEDIEKLNKQLSILEPLERKAELTNNLSELKILSKSRVGLEREVQLKELQRQQYIVQENENSLYGKSKVRIQSFITGNENGKDFILYIIEVQKIIPFESIDDVDKNENFEEDIVTSGWMVARRFSQFYRLHQYLKSKYPSVSELQFPKRTVVMKFQQDQLVEERKNKLEKYLKALIKNKDVCSDALFRSFLSSEGFDFDTTEKSIKMKSKQKSVSNMATKLYNGISNQTNLNLPYSKFLDKQSTGNFIDTDGNVSTFKDKSGRKGPKYSNTNSNEMEKELSSFDYNNNNNIIIGEKIPFVLPICNLLVSVFSLSKSNMWLRGKAVILVLQQLLGSTIEKIARQYIDSIKNPDVILNILSMFQTKLWPGGSFKKSSPPRTQIQKNQTKKEAELIFEAFMLDSCSKVFGSDNARLAAKTIFSMLQNPILNLHLFYTVLQEILETLFPEIIDK
ncbi:hypothetical protein BVG19_g5471 [[Candida] boidinii]|nr:hypothetical protein BVG19_g5471 [[Candida] boidinii]OWB53951.1 hypothetical protein B5S27_g5568 [[Candida] boidinii]